MLLGLNPRRRRKLMRKNQQTSSQLFADGEFLAQKHIMFQIFIFHQPKNLTYPTA